MSLKDLVFSPPDFAASAFAGGPEFRSANGGGTPPGGQGNGQGGQNAPQVPNFKNRGEELVWLRSQKLNLLNEARAMGDRLKAEKRTWTPEEESRVTAIETQMQDFNNRITACETAIQGDASADAGSNSLPQGGKQSRSYEDFIAGLEKSFVGHNPAQQRSANGGQGQGNHQQPPMQNAQGQGGNNHRASQPIPAGAASINYMHTYGNKTDLELRRNAMQGWAGAERRNMFTKDQQRQHDEAAEVLGIDLRGKTFEIPISQEQFDNYRQKENRVMTVASSTLGSKAVPTTLIDKVVERLVAIAPIRTVADQFTTETGQLMPFPTIDDSANKGRVRASETMAGSKTDVAIGQRSYDCFEFASDIVLVSNRLIRDSIFALENRLGQLLPRRIARNQADKFTNGSGTGEPEGVVTSATAGATALAQAALVRRDLIKLQNSLDQEYQQNAMWQFPLCVLEALQLMETTTGEPLFHKISEGNPPLLLGKPWMLNQSMVSALSTGVVAVLYGDFRLGYSIRDVGSLVLSRSEEYAWDSEQVAFKAILSSDGRVVDPYAIQKLTMA